MNLTLSEPLAPPQTAAERRRRAPTVRAAERSLILLKVFASENRVNWTLDDLARRAGLPKSTTHRLLDTMARQGFVELGDAHGTYRLGLESAIVGRVAMCARRVEDVTALLAATPVDSDDGVGLAVLSGDRAVVVDRAAPRRASRWAYTTGASFPAHASAVGQVLLSGLTDGAVARIYAGVSVLEQPTRRSPGTLGELYSRLDQVRRDDYAIDDCAVREDLRCVAVPVRDAAGNVTHAVGASASATRWGPDDVTRLVDPLRRTARALGARGALLPRA